MSIFTVVFIVAARTHARTHRHTRKSLVQGMEHRNSATLAVKVSLSLPISTCASVNMHAHERVQYQEK